MRDELFEIWTLTSSQTAILVLRGELDIASGDRLPGEVARVLDLAPRTLLVDVQDVSFMDAVGLSGLLAAQAAALAKDVGFRIVAPSDAVMRVLNVLNLSAAFDIEESLVDAFARAA